MNEKHCVSLELAKQLTKAGWKEETEFYHRVDEYGNVFLVINPRFDTYEQLQKRTGTNVFYPAPLATEILEELPPSIKTIYGHNNTIVYIYLQIDKHPDERKGVRCRYRPEFNPEAEEWFNNEFREQSLPDALAKMWLYLQKEPFQ